MGRLSVFKISVLLALMVVLSACGDSDGVYTGSGENNEIVTSETTDSTDTSSSNEATSSARPRFVTSDCGSLPISDAVPGNERSAPTNIEIEQLVSGRIDPDSDSNFEHFWRIV